MTTNQNSHLDSLGAKLDSLELTADERTALDAIIASATSDDDVAGFRFEATYRDRLNTWSFTATDDLTNLKMDDPTTTRILPVGGGKI